MRSPIIPPNESGRLEALKGLKILDSHQEERFDRITRIAKKLFDVPIALVSLVDANRQWFKSKQGLDATETPRSISFCGHAILDDKLLIIEDATKDKRFFDNPLVLGDPNIRFYLGCPLKIKNQYNIGTLCIIDEKTRQFSEVDQETMRDLANMVESELESMHLSTTDELTTLSNRRGFLLIAMHAFNVCQRNNTRLTLLFFDLDKFKSINDTFGHAEGDSVLRTFSQLLLDNFRNSDVIARLGGDEFCVLCSDLEDRQINTLIEQFNSALKEYNKKINHYKIEYSMGHITYDPNKHQCIQDLIEEADKKMYTHKQR